MASAGPDLENVLDLSGDLISWQGGRQLCLIGEELFYLESITLNMDGSVTLNNLLRAKDGTTADNHSIGDVVYIIDRYGLTTLNHLLIASSQPLYVKTQPRNLRSFIDISTVSPVVKTYP
jgi:hypothetical protein